MAVWKWFQEQNRPSELEALYDMLNDMWQEDRKSSTPEELAGYSRMLDIERDSEFQRFLRELDKGFIN